MKTRLVAAVKEKNDYTTGVIFKLCRLSGRNMRKSLSLDIFLLAEQGRNWHDSEISLPSGSLDYVFEGSSCVIQHSSKLKALVILYCEIENWYGCVLLHSMFEIGRRIRKRTCYVCNSWEFYSLLKISYVINGRKVDLKEDFDENVILSRKVKLFLYR